VYFGHIRTPNPSTSGQVTIAIAGHYTVALTTGARKIANEEGDYRAISLTYSTIITIKVIFFLISIPIIFIFTILNTRLYECRELIYILLLLLFSNVIMPTWLFQGLQKVKLMTVSSLAVRVIFLISVFALVKSRDDMCLYICLYSVSFLVIAVLSSILIKRRIKLKLYKVSINEIKSLVIDGFYVFASSAVISLISSSGTFVLGLFHTSVEVGYYSGISKITQVITMLYYPIGQALYPYHCKKYTTSYLCGFTSVIKITKYILTMFAFISGVVVIFRRYIVALALGSDYLVASDLLLGMVFIPILSIVSNLLGTQVLVASNHNKEYSSAFLKSSIIYIALYLFLGYYFTSWGVVFGTIIGEVVCIFLLFLKVKEIYVKESKTL
jgi:PST family polysaccharide transporter